MTGRGAGTGGPGAGHGRLSWVEAGRGLAAVTVMVSHLYVVHPVPFDTYLLGLFGAWAVSFFFVLSGYIMCHVHGQDIGHPGRAPHFVWRRLVRIFPTYLLVLALALAVNQLLQRPEARVALTAPFLVRQALLLPGETPFIGPSGTLRPELFFYALFALTLLNRWLGYAAFALWAVGLAWYLAVVGLGAIGQPFDSPRDVYLHDINIPFFEGLALGFVERRTGVLRFAAANLLLAAALFGLGAWRPDPRFGELAMFAVFGAVLAGLVWASRHARPAPRVLVWLGAISYSLYLVHMVVYTVLRGVDHLVGRPLDPVWPVRVAIQFAAAIGAAALLHRWFERPVLRWLNGRRTVLGLQVGRPAPVPAAG